MRSKGFTLLEISIVIAIMGVMMAGGAVIFSAALQRREADETNEKMQKLQQTLLEYRRANNRIPCPGDLTQPITSSTYGVEAATVSAGVITGCNSPAGTPPVNYNNGDKIFEGLIPTKTLNLPDDYAIDGWGRRIMYVVDQQLAITNAFATIPVNDTADHINILDAVPLDGPRTRQAVYVLISFGPNGHGAYPRNGGSVRINANSANSNELINCYCNGTPSTLISNVFIQSMPVQDPATPSHTNDFDDVVTYATRRQLRSLTE